MNTTICEFMALTMISALLLSPQLHGSEAVRNVARDGVATASGSENDVFVPAKAIDGIVNRAEANPQQSRWGSNMLGAGFANGVWTASGPDATVWLQVDLGRVVPGIEDIFLEWEIAKALDYSIKLSDDGRQWRTAWKSSQPCADVADWIRLPEPQAARFVRLDISSFKRLNWPTVSVYEFEIYNGKMPGLKAAALSFDPERDIDLSGERIVYRLPEGVSARVAASTHLPLIGMDGRITRPLSDKRVEVTFELSDGRQSVLTPTCTLALSAARPVPAGGNPKPSVVPALQEWRGAQGLYRVHEQARIVIDSSAGQSGLDELKRRMEVFAADFAEMTQASLQLETAETQPRPGDISLKLIADDALGEEGYFMNVSPDGIQIAASHPQGAFWATRTILQVLRQNGNSFPCGMVRDYPRYRLRGFMYDVARQPASLAAVRNVMKTMSWYKMNDFQLHLNDNYIWLHEYTQIPNGRDATDEQRAAAVRELLEFEPTPCAFRLESDMVGANGVPLTTRAHFYSKAEFSRLIEEARLYGVTIVPEIDVPGHAMSFVRVRPELMYRGRLTKPHDVERVAMLDASDDPFPGSGHSYRAETLEFVQTVFDEYMLPQDDGQPVFRSGIVHIGTDEYYGDAEDYRAFADAMLKYVKERGFTPRLWGSLTAKPGQTPVANAGVQMHIWALGWQQPQAAIDQGYDIINILDQHSYMVPNGTGNVGAYGDFVNLPNVYRPEWHPHVMGGQKVLPGHPRLLGAQWALWNDKAWRRDHGLSEQDLYDRIRKTCSVFAEKSWNSGVDLSFDAFMQSVEKLDVPPRLSSF